METLIKKLVDLASQRIASDNDDFMVDDYAGGNIDDAFSLGCDCGEVQFARDLLDEFFPESEYEIEEREGDEDDND